MAQSNKTTLRNKIEGRSPAQGAVLNVSFSYMPKFPRAGQDVQFIDTSTGKPGSWQWDFGDGATSTAQNPVHVFNNSGSKTVILAASNGVVARKKTLRVAVFAAKSAGTSILSTLSPSFTSAPLFPIAGQTVQFTDTTTGAPSSWQWNFGDGTTSNTQNPSHSYAAAGSYNVSLMVNSGSGSKTYSSTVTVKSPEVPLGASFSYTPGLPTPGQAVNFTDASKGNPTSWQWDFGDGIKDTSENPSHIYAAAGSYGVTLTISAGSDSTSTSTTITIGQSDVITATSASYADVSTAISKAQSGDTVIIPAGKTTWSSPLVITKGIKLIGAGIGQTVITSGYSGHTTYTNYCDPASHLITYYPQHPELDEPFRLSGFTMDLNANCYGPYLYNPTLKPLTKVRIDHCDLSNSYTGGMELIMVVGTVYGCIDNNVLSGGPFMFRCFGLNDVTWNNLTFEYGTANNIYFEDNVINCNDSIVEGGGAGRYAFRYNVINLSANVYGIWDAHGNQPGADNATVGIEVYENTINWGSYGGRIFDHRGGMALVYNNDANSTSWVEAQTREEYLDSVLPPAFNPISGQPQHVYQSYYWNNTRNGTELIKINIPPGIYGVDVGGQQVDYGGTIGLVPQWNVDCWKQVIGFDGTAGMGVGLLSNRPAIGTVGVGYWATDTKTLYRWTANNKWEAYYTPFTYPHPLRNDK